MLADIFTPALAPFSIAIFVMLFIAAMEAIGLFFGATLSGFVDGILPDFDLPDIDVDVDAIDALDADVDIDVPELGEPTAFQLILGWLAFGRVPALALFVAFLTAFGLVGFATQGIVQTVTGLYLPSIIAVVPALFVALPATRYLGLALGAIMPKEETEAVSVRRFIGKLATITMGAAKRGLPAQAKLKDRYGQTHYVLVEPDADDEEFQSGTEVLLVRQVGSTFRAIENLNAVLSKTTSG